jgi:FkbM family methyltransferase
MRYGTIIKKKLIGKNKNLISFDEPYDVMAELLKNRGITGIIDAGASNGRISKCLIDLFPSADVYAFEPNPMYAETLNQFAREEKRFHPQFLALSDCEGIATLNITDSPGCTSLFKPSEYLKKIRPKESTIETSKQVQVVTIDNWAKRNSNLEIQLMKFDIQAGELKALKGAINALQNSTLMVYTEVLFNPLYEDGAIFSEIDLFLRKYGFALYDIYKPKYGQRGQLMWANAIFVNAQRMGM